MTFTFFRLLGDWLHAVAVLMIVHRLYAVKNAQGKHFTKLLLQKLISDKPRWLIDGVDSIALQVFHERHKSCAYLHSCFDTWTS